MNGGSSAASRASSTARGSVVIDPQGFFNARPTCTYDERFSISVWGKNLSNKFHHTYGFNPNTFCQDHLTRGAPRTFGMEGTVRF